jgi:hypothetical protein
MYRQRRKPQRIEEPEQTTGSAQSWPAYDDATDEASSADTMRAKPAGDSDANRAR